MKKLTFLFLMLVAFVTTSMAQFEVGKEYRLKDVSINQYLTAFNHNSNPTGPNGGVGTAAFAEDNGDQIFVFEQSGSNYKIKTRTGYYIYAQEWNVDALSTSSDFKFSANGTSGYYMQVYNTNKGNSWYYVKNENVGGTYYLFGDAALGAAATWVFEEVVVNVPSRTITVSANNNAWGTVTGGGTAEGAIMISAIPAEGCKFVEWQLNGVQVSTETSFTDVEEGDKEYVAIFAELSPYELICKPTFAGAGNTSFVSAATILANGETSTIDVSSLAVKGQQGFVEAGETYAGATFDLNLTYTINWGNVTIFQIEEDQTSVIYGPYDGIWPTGNPISAMATAGITVNGNTATFEITIPSNAQVGDMIVIRSLVGSAEDACQTGISEGGYIDFIFTVANPPYTVTVTSSNESMGTVSPASAKVRGGETITISATPNEGCEFVNWTVEGTEVSTEASFTATVTAETAYVANFVAKEFTITYMVDGEEYASETYAFGATVTPVAVPAEKEGYTFSGWSEIPATMPAENVTVTGTFAVNSYDIVYYVDGEEYTTETYEFGAAVTPVAAPVKEGYTFSGWSAIPATMPAENVTVTGTFTIVIKEDVEVTDDNKEENADATYANVTVANEKVWDIKANIISADKVSVSVSATGAASQIKIEDGGQVTAALEVNRVVKKGEWAMMALPFAVDLTNVTVDGVDAQNNVNIKVMVYDAAKRANESIELWTKSGWVDLTGTTIAANQGFAVAVNAQNGDEQTVTFASALQIYDGADKEVALDRHASTVNEGADADWNFFGNPTLANAEKGTNYALYIYNAEDDSYDEYSSSDNVTCQPYAAMFTQSADDFNTLSFSNGTAGVLNDANGVFGEMQFSLNGEDEARVVLVDEASEEYVRNEDALYFAAPNANLSQLYIVKGKVKMAVSEQPALSESMALGYKAAKAGEQTLTLTSLPDNASVVLKDNVTGDEVALTVGDSYTFESAAGTFNSRFVVIPTNLTGIAQATAEGDVKVIVNGDDINVYGVEAGVEVVAYTTNGMVVASAVATEGVTTLSTSANGVIVVKVANTAIKVVK